MPATSSLPFQLPVPEPYRPSPGSTTRHRHQLQVVRANNLTNLRPVGGNLFNTIDQTDLSAATEVVDTPDLRVGFVEQSGVDSIATLTGMIEANRAVTANSKLMQYHNQLMQQAVSTLGRVA